MGATNQPREMDIDTVIKKLQLIHHDPLFTFDEESHSYHYGWMKMDGATGWIHKNFVHEFDEDFFSKKVAKREGVSQEEILEKWRKKNLFARELGHCVHEFIEKFIEDPSTPIPKGPEGSLGMMLQFVTWYKINMQPNRINLMQEARLHGLPTFKNAGTADDPFWSIRKNGVIVNDWKTNEKFTTDKDYAFNQLKAPFHNYKENKHNIYSIQISLYRLMLEAQGIPTVGGMITWIPRSAPPLPFEAKDFRPELRKFLKIS